MGREKDQFWAYAVKVNGRFKCNFCEQDFPGGASRIKAHLAGVPGHDIKVCNAVPQEVQEKAQAITQKKREVQATQGTNKKLKSASTSASKLKTKGKEEYIAEIVLNDVVDRAGGTTRIKYQLAGAEGYDINICKKVPKEVQEEASLTIGEPNKKLKGASTSNKDKEREFSLTSISKDDILTVVFEKDIVLCKIYRKVTSLKVLEQRAAMEEEMKFHASPSPPPSSSLETVSFCTPQEDQLMAIIPVQNVIFNQEVEDVLAKEEKKDDRPLENKVSPTSLQFPLGKDKLPELQVPELSVDWNQDPFWIELNSPGLQNLTPGKDQVPELQVPKLFMDWKQDPFWIQSKIPWLQNLTPYANLLNF